VWQIQYMGHLNVEIKAKSTNHEEIRKLLKSNGADFKGIDHQIDTYFRVSSGRLKLREGKIENFLIHYAREDTEGPKQSHVTLFKSEPESSLKEIFTKALGILITVDKQREIYFIDNVKFHIDTVKDLGTFVEIEAIDKDGSIGKDKLTKQCQFFLDLFRINSSALISVSYSDLLLNK
jgi:predicted adenylyl cyclase CyaB